MQAKSTRPSEHKARSRVAPIVLAAWWVCATACGGASLAARAGSPSNPPTGADTPTASELEAVRVTARRREENAQDVPAPISSVSGRQLEMRRLDKVQELQQVLPNLNAPFLHARNTSLAVRGIGNNPANEGLEASVGTYLDNVFLGRPGMAVIELLDIDQIDLLRGPQGTLFGKNTTAGVLNISTHAPVFDTQRSVSVSLGQHGYGQLKAVLNSALTDTVAGRLTAYRTHLGGFVKNDFDGTDRSGYERRGARAQLLLQPDARFSLRLVGDYHEETSDNVFVLYGYGPTNAAGSTVFTRFGNNATGLSLDPEAYRTSINAPQAFKTRQAGVSAEANWLLGHGAKLTSITALRSWQFDPSNDQDSTQVDGIRAGGTHVRDWQGTQELRLATPKGERFEHVLGAFALKQSIKNETFFQGGAFAVEALGLSPQLRAVFNNTQSTSYGAISTQSLALFGHSTWHMDPVTDLSGGLRFTQEEKKAHVERTPWTDSLTSPFVLPLVTPTRNSLAFFGAWASGPLSRRDDSLATQLTLSRKLSPDVLAYTGFSSGSKSGGYNLNGVSSGPATGAQSLSVDPEKASNWELGFKSQWLDKRLSFNANLYSSRIKGYQANSFLLDASKLPVAAIINVGIVKAQGIEFDLAARATPSLSLGLSGAYNDARYASFTKAPPALENNFGAGVGGVADLSGQTVNGAPRWTLNAHARQRFSLVHLTPHAKDAYVAANYAWRSGAYGDVSNSAYSRIPAHGLLNLAAGLRLGSGPDAHWDLSIWARNALDKRHFLAVTANPGLAGTYFASAGQPRTLGVSLSADF
jgi:iron complex outermembrane receptor protein